MVKTVNFTREPIIETIITPREGCRLVVRSSKQSSQTEYCVDALEVVSFGHSFFYRSTERPKPFLVPVGDYEIVELKEVRMNLKNASPDRSIKIGGGKEPSFEGERPERKRRKRNRRDREKQELESPGEEFLQEEAPLEGESETELSQAEKPAAFVSKLFPPPTTLIRDNMSRYKPQESGEIPQEEKKEEEVSFEVESLEEEVIPEEIFGSLDEDMNSEQ